MDLTVLDCTLRDGGYYNNWDFDDALVNAYLTSISAANVPVVEIGFRSFPKDGFYGAYAYSTDETLAALNIPDSLSIAVMLDAKDILGYDEGVEAGIHYLFSSAENSPVDIVRIAAHFDQVMDCLEIITPLKQLGYQVCINIMQSGNKTSPELEQLAKNIASWNCIDVLYFADSLGNMMTEDIHRVAKALIKGWSGPLGIHAHNNKGMAVSNTLTAAELGVSWLDATIMGMGRGAGNGQTEILLMELENKGHARFLSEQLFQLVLKYFMPLQQTHNWGPSVLYHYAANKSIHPTYIQELLSDNRYRSNDIITSLKNLANITANSYQLPLLEQARRSNGVEKLQGKWQPAGFCQNRDVIILGAGTNLDHYQAGIKRFIKKYKPIVVSINIHQVIEHEIIDYYVASQQSRLMLDVTQYKQIQKPLIMPERLIPKEILNQLAGHKILDYDMQVAADCLEIKASGCIVPLPLTLAYALAAIIKGGAAKIFMVGFDGYSADDHRQEEMIEMLSKFKHQLPDLELISLTPTTYPLKRGSIYAPY